MSYKAEYIWIDGTRPTAKLRSKTKILAVGDPFFTKWFTFAKVVHNGAWQPRLAPTDLWRLAYGLTTFGPGSHESLAKLPPYKSSSERDSSGTAVRLTS